MLKRFMPAAAITILVMSSSADGAMTANQGYALLLAVPVQCTLRHEPALAAIAKGYRLGELIEYCNAPAGYSVQVSYAPGSMRGAVVTIGEDSVVLDGSGQTIVSRTPGPRIRDRIISAEPGQNGFDTDRLDFAIVTN